VTLESPAVLRATLIRMFPDFEAQSDEAQTYHQVVMDLSPFITRYLEQGTERSAKEFGALVNRMVEAGGAQQNAIETCLLEHASQVGCAKLLRPHLGPAAQKELR
jgi:hypothetical protein